MSSKYLKPTQPGEILLQEFLVPLGISQYKLAKDIGVPQSRVSKITKKERGITIDTALRLARYLSTSAEFWVNLQANYDLKMTKARIGKHIVKEIHPFNQAA